MIPPLYPPLSKHHDHFVIRDILAPRAFKNLVPITRSSGVDHLLIRSAKKHPTFTKFETMLRLISNMYNSYGLVIIFVRRSHDYVIIALID